MKDFLKPGRYTHGMLQEGEGIRESEVSCLTFNLREIAVLPVVAASAGLDELQELFEAFSLGSPQFRVADANSKTGAAAGHNSVEDHPFHPNLAVRNPQSDFDAYAGGNGSGGFDEASAQAGIREIAPNRGCGIA